MKTQPEEDDDDENTGLSVPSKPIDYYESLDEDRLAALLKRRYKYDDDEIKVLFKNEDEMRDALRKLKTITEKGDDKDEDQIGWDEEDKETLTKDQESAVTKERNRRKRLEEAREKLRKKMAGKPVEEEEEPAKTTPMAVPKETEHVTSSEVKQAMKDVLALFGVSDDDEDTPPKKKKGKKKKDK